MKRFLVVALLLSMVAAGGCGSTMMTETSDEFSEQGGWLNDWLGLDFRYFGGLYGDTTRVDATRDEIAGDMDEAWLELSKELGPPPPVDLPPAATAVRARVDMPSKRPVVAPPKETQVERLPDGRIVIIRRPDGAVTITNKPEEEEK